MDLYLFQIDEGWALALAVSPAVIVPVVILLRRALRRRRRAKVLSVPPPPEWEETLRQELILFRRLSPDLRPKLFSLMQIFLAEKRFEGCGGLLLTERMRLLVAAQACLLLLGGRLDVFPKLSTVLIYPASFFAEITEPIGGVYGRSLAERVGESSGHGVVVLAWDQVRDDIENWCVGCNVVIHEFAHQLDQLGGEANGVPELPPGMSYAHWSEVLGQEFEELVRADNRGDDTLIDPYGAESPAEFFSVVSELFFERPGRLRMEHPELYAQFQMYYGLDPASWRG